jgi:predicted RNase H-like nuclease
MDTVLGVDASKSGWVGIAWSGPAVTAHFSVLDAAVAAWTARRVHLGTALALPNPPQVFADGIEAAIWR